MRGIADFLIAAVDLVDVEVGRIQRTAGDVRRATVALLGLALVAIVGVCLLLAALVLALGPALGYAAACGLTGLVALAAAWLTWRTSPWLDR